MASVVDIYNLALGRIGTDKSVATINENTKEQRLCTRFYPQCRDEVLEAGAWPFAVKYKPLALLGTTGQIGGWAFEYDKPEDCLRILEVTPERDVGSAITHWCGCTGPWESNLRANAQPYRQALGQTGNTVSVLSNVEGAYIIYVARIDNPSVFSPLMVSCIADRLAMELSMPMSADPRYLQMCLTRYNNSFMIAAGTQYEQEKPSPEAEAPGIRARQ